MSMRAEILQVITDTDRRGAQVFATDLHAALDRSGRSVRTVALSPGSMGGLPVDTLGPDRFSPRTLRALRGEIKAADVVVAHGSSTLPACALTASGIGTPFVYRQVSDSLFWAPTLWRRLRVRLGLSRAARVVALWSGAAQTLHTEFGVSLDRIRVIANGVPSERVPRIDSAAVPQHKRSVGLDPQRLVVACVGALVPEKGIDIAIDAIGQVASVQLLVIGDGRQRSRLEEQANRVAPGRVVFTGSLPDPAQVLAAADLVVFPSLGGDSLPAVLIEAGFAELPTVATRVQGVPEIVLDGVTGQLVPIGSSTAIAAAIGRLISDRAYARRLGRAARRHCLRRFSMSVVAPQWAQLLTEVNPRSALDRT
jgi:glycosyltransferase involved in cell wall biosynthesis